MLPSKSKCWRSPLALLLGAALAQTPTTLEAQTNPATSANPGTLQQQERNLEAARAEQQKAAEAEQRLRQEIDAIGEDRRKLNRALLDVAAKIRSIETKVTESQSRLVPLQADEQKLRRSLESRQGTIAEILAALQRMGRQPPPALMVRPEDALQSLRTAMMLGAVLPDMRTQAQAIAGDLSALLRLRAEIDGETTRLHADLAALGEDQRRMSLLIEERQKQQAKAEQALEAERQKAAALARQVDNLKDLISGLEQTLDSAGRAARTSEDQKGGARNLAALQDPGRLTPAIAFGSARNLLPLPVNGVKIRDFGVADGLGGAEKGISIATRAGAQVTSPCDGWVVYVGPFRSYGQLLILNAGGGYHVLLAGMERISVDLGQFVLTGEPVAVMGSASQVAAAAPIGSSQPALYIEFRKDGIPIDSGPWWATSEGEKVRG